MTVDGGATPAILEARRRRRGRSAAAPPIAPRKGKRVESPGSAVASPILPHEGKRGESPGAAVGTVADRAGSAWPTLENEALYDAALSERGCILAAAPVPCDDGQALENARNGKGWLLAGVGMDLGSAPRSLVSKPRFTQRLAALTGEDWLDDASGRVSGRHAGHRRHRHVVAIEGGRGAANSENLVIGPLRSLRSASPRSPARTFQRVTNVFSA